ncbi:PKD domain-containing protein [Filimonas effusa]|uniref:PKD domain-containing protein n=1 Tax=Filimonas effusa TaxID=2508721 RepID=A0A4Q1D366_9BACT|nr:PKD domain-containing protein [Filimonas effusa]RXK82819.1 PKD domain-containing protein [Filimonas effusa]
MREVMTMRKLYIILFLLGLKTLAVAQNITNKGTEFWAGFGHAAEMENNAWLDTPRVAIAFSAEQDAKVTVSLHGTTYKREYRVPANTVVRSENIPQGLRDIPASPWDAMLYSRSSIWPGGTNSEGTFRNKGIHIESDVPIVAYEIEYAPFSAAATMLIPVKSWGYSYRVLSHDQTVTEFEKLGRFAWIFVVAHYDNTRIEINPTNATRSGLPAGTPFYATLNKGEIYQVMANVPTSNIRGSNDFIGTTVKSVVNSDGTCFPIAAFVGSSGAYVSCGSFSGSHPPEDMAIQQMFPVETWGRRYITTPSSVSSDPTMHNANLFRVMPKLPGTIVKRNGAVMTGMTSKGYYEYWSSASDYIEANEPVQVMQILPSTGTCGYQGLGDPEMIFLSPIEQGIKKTAFQRLAFPGMEARPLTIDWNFLTLNIPTAGLASLTIDGLKNNYSHTYPNPNLPGYSVVVRRWNTRSNTDPRAPATCIVESDSTFNAITYGFSSALSYSYNAGTYINNLSGVPFLHNKYNSSDTANHYTCARTPVELSVLIRYQPSRLLWQLSDLNGTITPAADIVDNSPVAAGQEMVSGVLYYRYRLPGVYTFLKPGEFSVPVFATASSVEQCANTERIPYDIIVKDSLRTGFSILYENCRSSELIRFAARGKFNDSSEIKRWEWEFMDGATPGTASGRDAAYTFHSGNNSARLIAIDGNACVADTTALFALVDKPATPVFNVAAGTFSCEQAATALQETNPMLPAHSWYWNFGDGEVITATANGQHQSHTYKSSGQVTIKHVLKISENCISDTALLNLQVYAKPVLNVTHDKGCLPSNGIVQFKSNVTATDGQLASALLWNFGDAAATPANPNTAATASPSHKYSAGTYQLQLKATTEKGCVNDSSWQLVLQPAPAISFSALDDVCLNTASVSVARATVTNGLTGSGYYRGEATANDGTFQPEKAGMGSHAVWYIYTTTQGCKDSASANIFVKPVPAVAFTAPEDLCLNAAATLTDLSVIDNSKDPGAAIQSRTWSFGDGTPDVTRNTAAPFDKNFAAAATYTVTLKATGNNGCIGNTATRTIKVHALPDVQFTLPDAVCMPGGEAVFTNNTTISEQGALSYYWTFGDGNTATAGNPIHTYATAKAYKVSLKATSAFGCSASLEKNMSSAIFKNGPVAGFDLSDKAPCEGTTVVFTDKSTAAAAPIVSWSWSFGDGTTDNKQNTNKKFEKAGAYLVHLSVTDNDGCTSRSTDAQGQLQVKLSPRISAGPDLFGEEGDAIILKATAEQAGQLRFTWSPSALLDHAGALNPAYKVIQDQVFTLTATDKDGVCSATDDVKVTMLRSVVIPDAFTPNDDGIHDLWEIKNLFAYTDCTVAVFNRYGQQVYHSKGYAAPWNGTQNGSRLPSGTYYYIIQLKKTEKPLTGSVTILR